MRAIISSPGLCKGRCSLITPAFTNAKISPRISRTLTAKALPPSLDPNILYAGGAALVGLFGIAGWQFSQQGASEVDAEADDVKEVAAPPPLPRENAVLVVGSTGRVGRRVVQKLVAAGRTVVAASRTQSKAEEVFSAAGLQMGIQQDTAGLLFVESGVDVTKPETLDNPKLWEGVTQVVSMLGPVFGPQPGGGMGYIDNMSPERVEAAGAQALMAVLPKHLKKQVRSSRDVLPMRTAEDLTAWDRLDDVIMGGQSSSTLSPIEGGDVQGAIWKGDLITDGGGFCGTRTKRNDMDLSDCDGIHMRIKGDGQIFKMNIKTVDQLETPESTFQATFDTVDGAWSDVYIPWHNFVNVKRAQANPDGAPLDPSKISKFGLVLSRFEFNSCPNPAYKPGPWELQIEGGLRAYKDVRPQVLLISSAGVERNAVIGDDEERRKKDIPIVQLNPGATLNHKYTAEVAVRASGYPYTVTRFTGMVDSPGEGGPFLLDADQGDIITGSISRDEAASAIVAALGSPEAVNKTFEVRRGEALDARGVQMGRKEWLRMFVRLALDRNRWRVGLPPFPKAVLPPPPVTEARTAEILADVTRVRSVQEAAAQVKAPVASSS